jgi:tetratricopeptide (TPR) repeat protein
MEELELPKLAAKLRPYMGKAAGPEDVLYPIFKEINYLSYEELRGLNERLAKLIRELPAVRRKKKGDELVANGMYVSAIRVYQEVLKEEADLSTSPEMIGSIYHNLGCACSYLFQMEKAAEYFWMAYEEEKSEKALKTYLLAYQMAEPDDKLEARMEELEVSVEMKADVRGTMERGKKATLEELDIKTVDEILAREMKEYHRSTGA